MNTPASKETARKRRKENKKGGGEEEKGKKGPESSYKIQKAHLPPKGTTLPRLLAPAIIHPTVRINVPLFNYIRPLTARTIAFPCFLLRRSRVPAEGARHRVDPLVWRAEDRREGVLRGGNGHVVTLLEFNATFAVECAPGG